MNPRTTDDREPIQPIGERSVATEHAPSVPYLTILATRGPTGGSLTEASKNLATPTLAPGKAGHPAFQLSGDQTPMFVRHKALSLSSFSLQTCFRRVVLPRAAMPFVHFTARRACTARSAEAVLWNDVSRRTWKLPSGARKRCKVARLLDAGRDCAVTLTPIRV